MNTVSIKTAYHGLKEFSSTGKAYPADGAVTFIQQFKHLFIGNKLNAILNTWIADTRFSYQMQQNFQQDMADDIEWEGPFVLTIGSQKLFIDFSAPEQYEIGINSQSIAKTIDICSTTISELEKNANNEQFVDISPLYNHNVIGQVIRDIHVVVDNRYTITHLVSIIVELQNCFCLVFSEEIDNPMMRVYSNIDKALDVVEKIKEQNFNFYK